MVNKSSKILTFLWFALIIEVARLIHQWLAFGAEQHFLKQSAVEGLQLGHNLITLFGLTPAALMAAAIYLYVINRKNLAFKEKIILLYEGIGTPLLFIGQLYLLSTLPSSSSYLGIILIAIRLVVIYIILNILFGIKRRSIAIGFIAIFLLLISIPHFFASSKVLWKVQVSTNTLDGSVGPLRIQDGVVYSANENGGIYATSIAMGKVLWKFGKSSDFYVKAVTQPLTVTNDTVFVVNASSIQALNRTNGIVRWESAVIVTGESLVDAQTIIVPTKTGLVAYDIATGQIQWQVAATSPVALPPKKISDDVIVYGEQSGVIKTIHVSDRSTVWQASVGEFNIVLDIYGGVISPVSYAPVITEDSVVVGDKTGVVYSFDKKNGQKNWQTQIGQLRCPNFKFIPTKDTLYTSINEQGCGFTAEIAALNLSDGSIVWKHEYDWLELNSLALDANIVYIAVDNSEPGIYPTTFLALDSKTGNTLWEVNNVGKRGFSFGDDYSEGVLSDVTFLPEQILVGTQGGVVAIDRQTHEQKLVVELNKVYEAPIVVDGHLLVTGGASIMALDL